MKKKSDYAIVISCTPGYGFGMMATMNAQNHFKTDADWEIAYEGYTDEEREKISAAFPFNVNWTPVNDLMKDVVDKRTDQRAPLDRMWLAYWLMANKVLKEKKYKAVCVIQADEFVFYNLDVYFKMAESGFLVCSEFPFTYRKAEQLPFGDDRAITDRWMFGIFDAVTFIGQEYADLPMDIVHFQEEDAFIHESNHSVVALNRGVCRHGKLGKVLGLEGRLWCCDGIWAYTKLYIVEDRVYNHLGIRLYGWHARWWQVGRAITEWNCSKPMLTNPSSKKDAIVLYDTCEHNYNLVRDFMARFNNMIPEIKSEIYEKNPMIRTRYELGE